MSQTECVSSVVDVVYLCILAVLFLFVLILMKQGSGFFVNLHNCIKLHFHHHFSYLYCIVEVIAFSKLKKPLSLSRHKKVEKVESRESESGYFSPSFSYCTLPTHPHKMTCMCCLVCR